jgi:hypothetical protein
MKKLFLLSAFSPLLLAGCSFNVSTPTEVDLDAVMGSGAEALSGVWNTTKDTLSGYYEDQIKPTVETAIETSKQEVERLAQEAKDQYNQQIEKLKVE